MTFVKTILVVVLTLLLVFAAGRLLPFDTVNWGRVSLLPAATVSVSGEAEMEVKSQVARFSAGVTVYNDDKQKAIDEVNAKVEKLLKDIKDFGIEEKDIKTQSVTISETPEAEILIYPPRDTSPGKWVVSNTLEIKLRDVDKASALADLLGASGATNVYGPSFGLDSAGTTSEEELLKKAIDNAREKAEVIAKAAGRKLGKAISVSEGSATYPYPLLEKSAGVGGSSEVPIEPGTQTTSKTVNVVFELR